MRLKVAIPVPLHKTFDYLPPEGIDSARLRPGSRIEVPFGRGHKTGLLLEVSEHSVIDPSRLKCALALLDEAPLLAERDLRLLRWASHYYHHPIGEVFATTLNAAPRPEGLGPITDPQRLLLTPTTSVEVEQKLERAPRQRALWQLLCENPDGLTRCTLREIDPGLPTLARALIDKGLASWQSLPENPTQVLRDSPPPLNPEQQAAVTAVSQSLGQHQTFLLEGVTGSGKTEVYLQLSQRVLDQGQQVIILLPEINLTPQLEARFRARLRAEVRVFHSALSDGERRRTWATLQQGQPAVLLGTRSATFIPAPRLGLIVLDEEHDPSFKQQEGFRFSARDVAIMRAHLSAIPILLGSATPSLESLLNAERERYRWLHLPYRAGNAKPPRFRLLDIRSQTLIEGLSAPLAKRIDATLARGEQSLLFVNRRGYAPTLICHECGWVAECRHCDANLVIHVRERRLRCHHCGFEQSLPSHCTSCGKSALQPLGLGTERIESALRERFPEARVARIDRDTTRRKGSLQTLLRAISEGHIDILIGTQMLAKGHHFPRVTLVGILDVDAGLYSTDFRAAEQTAQLVTQVAGRAGRGERPGEVILQTRHPDHPLLNTLVREGYDAFASASLEERQAAGLPPYAHQALWRAESLESGTARDFLERLSQSIQSPHGSGLQMLGPAPAPLARRGNRYRWQLLLQAPRRRELHAAVQHLISLIDQHPESRKVRWSVDIDPVTLY